MFAAMIWAMMLGYLVNEQSDFNTCEKIKFKGEACEKSLKLKEYGRKGK